MKLACLIEGRNFYAGWRKCSPTKTINFRAMLDCIVKQISDRTKTSCTLTDIVYYTGIDHTGRLEADIQIHAQDLVSRMRDAGVVVKTFPLKVKTVPCPHCGEPIRNVVEKEVDTAITVDALNLSEDVEGIVLCTNDIDILPLATELRDSGCGVWVAAWAVSPIADSLRSVVDGSISLNDDPTYMVESVELADGSLMLDELHKAEKKFSGGYVGLHFFLNRWHSDSMSLSAQRRSLVLNQLVDDGSVEIYVAGDGNKAVRVVAEQ